MIRVASGWIGTTLLLAPLASCGAPRGPGAAMRGVSAVVTEDSAVFVMPSGWDHTPLPPPVRPSKRRMDFGWAVLIPSPEQFEVGARHFNTDREGAGSTPLARLIDPSRLCLCSTVTGMHAHNPKGPPPIPRTVTARDRGDDVVLTLKDAPAVRMVFGNRPAQVWFRRTVRSRTDSVLVRVRYTSPATPRAPGPPHSHE